MNPQATAGRNVHFYDVHALLRPRAAIVNVDTAEDGLAQLTVLESTGPIVHLRVPYSEKPAFGCWSWMPYQKERAKTAEDNVSESAEPRPSDDLVGAHLNDLTARVEALEAAGEKEVEAVPDIDEPLRGVPDPAPEGSP